MLPTYVFALFLHQTKNETSLLLDIHRWKTQTMAVPQKCSFLPEKEQKTSMVLKEQ